LSTVSTFAKEIALMSKEEKRLGTAVIYALVSIVVGLLMSLLVYILLA